MKALVAFLLCAMLFAACGSKKKAESSLDVNPALMKETRLADVVQMVNAKRSMTEHSISAKINLNLSARNKNVRLGGSLKMKRNDVIQLSIVAFGLMEVGKLELTPDYMMIIDRVNHQFVKCAYTDVDFFQRTGINFYTFQSLFWNELFVLNNKGEVPNADNYTLITDNNVVSLVNAKGYNVVLTFIVDVVNQFVTETRFSNTGASVPVFKWTYGDCEKFSECDFPSSMKISFVLPKETVEAVIKINSVKPDSNWDTRTELNKNRYSEISLQAAFSKIMTLAE